MARQQVDIEMGEFEDLEPAPMLEHGLLHNRIGNDPMDNPRNRWHRIAPEERQEVIEGRQIRGYRVVPPEVYRRNAPNVRPRDEEEAIGFQENAYHPNQMQYFQERETTRDEQARAPLSSNEKIYIVIIGAALVFGLILWFIYWVIQSFLQNDVPAVVGDKSSGFLTG